MCVYVKNYVYIYIYMYMYVYFYRELDRVKTAYIHNWLKHKHLHTHSQQVDKQIEERKQETDAEIIHFYMSVPLNLAGVFILPLKQPGDATSRAHPRDLSGGSQLT